MAKEGKNLSSGSGVVDVMSDVIIIGAAVTAIVLRVFLRREAQTRLCAAVVSAFRGNLIKDFTALIPEKQGLRLNHMYEACDLYVASLISNDDSSSIRVNKLHSDGDELTVIVNTGQVIKDGHGGISFTWIPFTYDNGSPCFQLTVASIHKHYALKVYLPHVCRKAKEIKANIKPTLRLHTINATATATDWTYATVDHPATMGTVALDPAVKDELLRDLDLFLRGKDYYTSVGRSWRRGYLFYGPPGTGKSTLIAAMANYLRFDIFDLDLKAIKSNSHLRHLLLSTTARSILLIEDIDCSSIVSLAKLDHQIQAVDDDKISLSGLLNMMDGLWSCCGEGRIIVFTSNHKERLDPALLRPGRMDVHLEMSYCTFPAFKMLVSNYLYLSIDIDIDNHPLLLQFEDLLTKFPTTPAQIAAHLIKYRHANLDVALFNLVRSLSLA